MTVNHNSGSVLSAVGVSAGYAAGRVLHGISFEVRAGDVIALIGRNGVGKTTLLRCIMGLIKPDCGRIEFLGAPLAGPASAIASSGIAYVPQGRDIFSDFTVRENLFMGAQRAKKGVAAERFDSVLEYFPALRAHLDRRGGVLSGGQQQQLAIGRALMGAPKLLLLDEPTEGIQPNIVAHISDILGRVHESLGLPIIIVEQNLKFAMGRANRFLCMQKGSIAACGDIGELSEDVIAKYLRV
ncbi:MAG: ABC transporter ATP-binding protein [Oscillospiraceae bacterium]|jgi:urea transport system ATP-binding protein|nr:ABC transporter ATP-binding protein [Oscillospiraceae bacterium]